MVLKFYRGANVQSDYSEVYAERNSKIRHLNSLEKIEVNMSNIYLSYEGTISLVLPAEIISYNYMTAQKNENDVVGILGYFINIKEFINDLTAVVEYRFDFFFNTGGAYDDWGIINPGIIPKWDAKGIVSHSHINKINDCPIMQTYEPYYMFDLPGFSDYAIIILEGTAIKGTEIFDIMAIAAVPQSGPNTPLTIETRYTGFNREFAPCIFAKNGSNVSGYTISFSKGHVLTGTIANFVKSYIIEDPLFAMSDRTSGYLFNITYFYTGLPREMPVYTCRFKDLSTGQAGRNMAEMLLLGSDSQDNIHREFYGILATPKRAIRINSNKNAILYLHLNNKTTLNMEISFEGNIYDVSNDFIIEPKISSEQSIAINTAQISNAISDAQFQNAAINAAAQFSINADAPNSIKGVSNFATAAANTALEIYNRKRITDINKEKTTRLSQMKPPTTSNLNAINASIVIYMYRNVNSEENTEKQRIKKYYNYYGYGGEEYVESVKELFAVLNPYVEFSDVIIYGEITETEKSIISLALKKGIKFI